MTLKSMLVVVEGYYYRIHILPRRPPWGDILVWNTKYVNILIRPREPVKICHQATTVVFSPSMLSTVVNEVRRSKPVVHNHCPLCWRPQSRTKGGSTFFAVRYSLQLERDKRANVARHLRPRCHVDVFKVANVGVKLNFAAVDYRLNFTQVLWFRMRLACSRRYCEDASCVGGLTRLQ